MQCPLCGSENEPVASQCWLCDAQLELASQKNIILESEDLTGFRPHWGKILVAACLGFLVLLPWWSMSDLFDTPPDVQKSIHDFNLLSQSFRSREDEFTQKKEQIVTAMQRHFWNQDISKAPLWFEDLPLEVPLAFIDDDIGILSDKSLTLYPTDDKDELTFLLTKRDTSLWPINVTVSVEIGLDFDSGAIYPRFISLRRGARRLDPSLTWSYFGNELNKLRGLARFAGGIQQLSVFKAPIADEPNPHLSWKYQHRSFESKKQVR